MYTIITYLSPFLYTLIPSFLSPQSSPLIALLSVLSLHFLFSFVFLNSPLLPFSPLLCLPSLLFFQVLFRHFSISSRFPHFHSLSTLPSCVSPHFYSLNSSLLNPIPSFLSISILSAYSTFDISSHQCTPILFSSLQYYTVHIRFTLPFILTPPPPFSPQTMFSHHFVFSFPFQYIRSLPESLYSACTDLSSFPTILLDPAHSIPSYFSSLSPSHPFISPFLILFFSNNSSN